MYQLKKRLLLPLIIGIALHIPTLPSYWGRNPARVPAQSTVENSTGLTLYQKIQLGLYAVQVITPFIFAGILYIAAKNENQNRFSIYVPPKNAKGFSGLVGGAPKAVVDLQKMILDPQKYITLGVDVPKGFLFYGPPGTGKTMLGRAIAEESNMILISIKPGDIIGEYIGHTTANVKALFKRARVLTARYKKKVLIFIDEIDSVAKNRADDRGFYREAVSQLLVELDGITHNSNIITIGTTNRPEDIDQALWRSGRLEKLIEIPRPDKEKLIALFMYYLANKSPFVLEKPMSDFIDDIATKGESILNAADVAHIVNQAALLATDDNSSSIALSHLQAAYKELLQNALERPYDETANQTNQVGVVNGLAYTSSGGEVLKIETAIMPGHGKLMLTGQLGNVMQESAQAALSYIRAHANEFGIDHALFNQHDIHLHFPAGGIPKDGPSAGVGILVSMLSALTNRPVDAQYAMTGELNLRGNVMPIGGLKEKLLAAKRHKIAHVILPAKNKVDIEKLEKVTEGLDIIWVEQADEVIQKVLLAAVA